MRAYRFHTYLYHPNPCNFPWQTLSYHTVALHMRNIIISILQTDHSPVLNINPLPHHLSLITTTTTRIHVLRNLLSHIHRATKMLLLPTQPPPSLSPAGDEPHHYSTTSIYTPPTSLLLTNIATWKINRQSSYDWPLTRIFTDTSMSSTVPNRRILLLSRDHLPPPRSLAQLTR